MQISEWSNLQQSQPITVSEQGINYQVVVAIIKMMECEKDFPQPGWEVWYKYCGESPCFWSFRGRVFNHDL